MYKLQIKTRPKVKGSGEDQNLEVLGVGIPKMTFSSIQGFRYEQTVQIPAEMKLAEFDNKLVIDIQHYMNKVVEECKSEELTLRMQHIRKDDYIKVFEPGEASDYERRKTSWL